MERTLVITTLLLLLAISACVAVRPTVPVDTEPKRLPANSSLYSETSDQDDVSLKSIQTILQKHPLRSIEELLRYLGEHHIAFMERHTFVFESRSLHGASYENPRAIVFGKSADFILTFNGSPEQDSFDKLEVAQLNAKSKTYEFFEIAFTDQGHHISKPGGPEGVCLQCHVNNKPIWDAYDVWPGVYGSVDGEPVHPTQKFLPNLPGISMRYYQQGEKKKWDQFSAKRSRHPRYKWLPIPQIRNEFLYDRSGELLLPNAELSVKLTRNNMQRIVADIKKNKNQFSEELVSQILLSFDCRATGDKVVEDTLTRLKKRYQASIQSVENKLKNHVIDMLLRYTKAPFFDRRSLIASLANHQYDKMEEIAAEGFQLTPDPEMNSLLADEITKGLECVRRGNRDFDFDFKTCFQQNSTPAFDKLNLNTYFTWLQNKGLLLTKSKASRIALTAAMINGNKLKLKTDSWSTLQFGEHDYSSGSGIEERLFRNGFAEVFGRMQVAGGSNSFGEYMLKKSTAKNSAFLSSEETVAYCRSLAISSAL